MENLCQDCTKETIEEFHCRGGKIIKLPDQENEEPEFTAMPKSEGVITGPGPLDGILRDEGMCLNCPDREFCSALCPAAARFAGQDYVSLREKPAGLLSHERGWPVILRPSKPIKMTDTEVKILRLVLEGKNFLEISQILDVSIDAIYFHAFNLRQKTPKDT